MAVISQLLPSLEDRWRPFGFYDAAFLSISGASDPEPSSASIQAAGLGLEGRVGERCTLRLAYGWVIDSPDAVPVDEGKLHFGARVEF